MLPVSLSGGWRPQMVSCSSCPSSWVWRASSGSLFEALKTQVAFFTLRRGQITSPTIPIPTFWYCLSSVIFSPFFNTFVLLERSGSEKQFFYFLQLSLVCVVHTAQLFHRNSFSDFVFSSTLPNFFSNHLMTSSWRHHVVIMTSSPLIFSVGFFPCGFFWCLCFFFFLVVFSFIFLGIMCTFLACWWFLGGATACWVMLLPLLSVGHMCLLLFCLSVV